MNPPPAPPSTRLKALVDRRLAGTITRVELAELETHLLTPQGLDYYLRCADIEASLTLAARSRPQVPANFRPTLTSAPARRLHHGTRHAALLAVAASIALLLAGAALFSHRRDTPPPATTNPVTAATLVRQIGPAAGTSTADIREIQVGESLVLGSGLAELATTSRATVLVEGPARLSFPAPDRLRLDEGRAVVRLFWGSRPFVIDHAPVVLTASSGEFTLERDAATGTTRVGVLDGRVSVAAPSLASPLPLDRRQTLELPEDGPPRTVATDLDGFHRHFPSRDLAWSAPADSFGPAWLQEDLSALVWGPGEYHARFKWQHGSDALLVDRCELLLDGRVVASDAHPAMVGDPNHTRDNCYLLRVPAEAYRRGKWTLRSLVRINPRALGQVQIPLASLPATGGVLRADDPRLDPIRRRELGLRPPQPDSHGLLLVDSSPTATREDACGTWQYTYNGIPYARTFLPDGTARFMKNGVASPDFDASRWTFENGVLTLNIFHGQPRQLACIERHLIRPDGSLVFLDRPYGDARKVASAPAP